MKRIRSAGLKDRRRFAIASAPSRAGRRNQDGYWSMVGDYSVAFGRCCVAWQLHGPVQYCAADLFLRAQANGSF